MPLNVIDVSKHQVAYAPHKAKLEGVDNSIIRVAYSTTKDVTAISWAPGIRESGQKVGAYGFGTWHYKSVNGGSVVNARNAMRTQVNAWVNYAKEAGVNWWFAIDQELEAGQTMGLGMNDNTEIINEAADILKAAGFEPMLYCSVSWDIAYIRTAILKVDYWMARYYKGDSDFGAIKIEDLPDGTYTRWMRKLHDSGKLIGWQFGSQAYGPKYGVGSANLDKSYFYKDSVRSLVLGVSIDERQGSYITVGPMSSGDVRTFVKLFEELKIPHAVMEDGRVITTIPVSTGDQNRAMSMAEYLQVGFHLDPEQKAPGESKYKLVNLGVTIKSGFSTAEDAIDYIETALGKDAIERYGISIEETNGTDIK